MILHCSDFDEKRRNARFKGWSAAESRAGFTVTLDNGDIVADVDWGEYPARTYSIGFADGPIVRTVPRKEVVPTVRLYLDAQRLRKMLATAKMMVVRPVTS